MDQTAYFEQMRTKRRTEILLAARELILGYGLHAFTMQQLARTLDISTVTLYKYFKNSEDVMEALRQHALLNCSVSGMLLPSSGDALKDFLEIYLYCYEELAAHRSDVSLIALTGSHLRSRDPADAMPPLPYPHGFYGRQLALLTTAQQEGQLGPGIEAADALNLMNGICESVLLQLALMTEEAFQTKEADFRRQFTEMTAMFRAYLTGSAKTG